MERHECYETFYELYEYVCISLETIVDHESHPHVYSSLSFTWVRETKTKTQGLLANLKIFGFIFTFVITKRRRQRGRVVRAPDLKSVGRGFKSRSDH